VAERTLAAPTAGVVGLTMFVARASVRAFSASARMNLLRLSGQAVTVGTEAVGAWILLDRAGGLGGWTTAEVLVLVGIAEAGLGLGMLVCEGLEPPTFSQMLREGRFDQALTRPVAPWLWVVANDIQIRNAGRVLAGVTVLVLAGAHADVGLSPAVLALVLGAVAAMAVTVGAVLTIGAAITMWTIEGTEVLNSFTYGGAALAGWPLHIYSGVLRAAFVWVVPVGAAVYVPTLWLLGRDGIGGADRWMLPLVPVLVAGFCLAAAGAWRAGVRHYAGAGG
jgi:ABC-2 type transport system permease protein